MKVPVQPGRWLRLLIKAIAVRRLRCVPPLLVLGLALSVGLAFRSQVGGD